MTTEIVESTGSAPATMIQAAIQGGADLDKLAQLLELQERWEANEARKAYNKAMAAFKANPPKIIKDRRVGYKSKGQFVGYQHASLANVTEAISSALSKHGLSASWTTEQNGAVVVRCKITHEMGHFEETSLSAPADTTGSKNSIQAIGSTITYLERYTLLALTGLATYDMDDDGMTTEPVLSVKQVAEIADLLKKTGSDEKKFCAYMNVDSVKDILASDYGRAMAALKVKAKKGDSNDN